MWQELNPDALEEDSRSMMTAIKKLPKSTKQSHAFKVLLAHTLLRA
jgi:hypothetical protein